MKKINSLVLALVFLLASVPGFAQHDTLRTKEDLSAVVIKKDQSRTLNLPVAPAATPQAADKLSPKEALEIEKASPDKRSEFRPRGQLRFDHVRDGIVLASYGPFDNLIVDAGETALRDCFGGTGTPTCTVVQNFKYHGIGTGTTAAAEGNTGCETELTTQYNPDNTRATGSQTNNGANVYRTVGTNAVDASVAITEFCLMSQAATGGGTMWTRIVFSAINLTSGDSLQTTYDLTIE